MDVVKLFRGLFSGPKKIPLTLEEGLRERELLQGTRQNRDSVQEKRRYIGYIDLLINNRKKVPKVYVERKDYFKEELGQRDRK